MEETCRRVLMLESPTCEALDRGALVALVRVDEPVERRDFFVLPREGAAGEVSIRLYARVVDWFEWPREEGKFLWALRMFRFLEPPSAALEGGEGEWRLLDREVKTAGATYVLNRTEFRRALERVQGARTR